MKLNRDVALILTGALLFAVVAVIALFKVGPELFPEKSLTLEFDSSCDLQAAPCSLALPSGGKIVLNITPRPILPMKHLQISATVSDQAIGKVVADFRGVSMNMGMNRFELKTHGDGQFDGGGMLPVCVRNRMDWEAQIWLATPEGTLVAPFRFITDKK